MKINKLMIVLIGITTIISCKNEPKSLSDLQSNFYEIQHNGLRLGDSLNVYFFKNQDLVDSVELTMNGKPVKNHFVMDSSNTNLGINKLEIKVFAGGSPITGETNVPILNSTKETSIPFEIVKEYPHPKELFTEGFFFHNQKMYESSGHYKKSKLVTYALGSTRYMQEVPQDASFFSEGIALLNGKIYQLTYREKKALVYDAESLKLIEEVPMPSAMKEGWGLTSDGEFLIASDGTQTLYFMDDRLNIKRKIQVAGFQSVYTYINELEFINGKIYANVWTTNFILEINPATGAVDRYYDLTSINEATGSDDVLNGIASYGNNILVTGKNWSNIYELSETN